MQSREHMASSLSVFIDESGTTSISDNQGPNRYYVSTAVIVRTADIPQVVKALDEISIKFNGGTPFKSEKIRDDKRCLKFLNHISELPFQYFSLVVDKQRIPADSGFRFRTSYYKCINKHLYQHLEKLSEGIVDIYIDNFGDHEFEQSCLTYFNGKSELFIRANPIYVNDKSHRLVQVADVISGTLRKYYFGKFDKETKGGIKSLLRNTKHEIGIQPYPAAYAQPTVLQGSGNSERDDNIAQTMLAKAGRFVEDNRASDDETIRMQAEVLQALIDAYYYGTSPVYGDALLAKLNAHATHRISQQFFHSRGIGGIRHLGIILAGVRKGYKLAGSEKDINAYLDFDRSVILPMLSKMTQARNFIQTNLGYDILEPDRFKDLANILSAYQNSAQQQLDDLLSNSKERDEDTAVEPYTR